MCRAVRENLILYVTENEERLYRIAYGCTGNRDAALDAVQNTVVKGLEHYREVKKPEYMRTWLIRILLNECYGYMRVHHKELAYEPSEINRELDRGQNTWQSAEEEALEGQEMYELVQRLPEKMRTIIILRFYEDLSLEEIARAIPCSLSTVKYRLYTALNKLKTWKEGRR